MPQVRDPKTGRYTSGGGSSYEAGASAGTNSRLQKAKSVGSGTMLEEWQTNPLPQLTDDEVSAVYFLINGKESLVYSAPVEDVNLSNIKSTQRALRNDSVEHFAKGGTSEDYPVILQTHNGYEVILDGNHRVYQALKDNKSTIKAHHVKVADMFLSNEELKNKYKIN